jgi:hypothetical protein
MLEWKRFFPPASPAQIERCERKTGISLPPCYRSFLLSANGGRPCKDTCFVIPGIAEEVMLGALFGISDERDNSLSLETVYGDAKDDIPGDFIPIGEDPGGNRLLLATAGAHKGGIFFWDRIGFLGKRAGKRLFQITANFDDFLESLRPIPFS